MKLDAAARRFDDLVCADAYTPSIVFKGQLQLYDDSKRDGATVERRVLSVAPAVIPPARRVLSMGGREWLIGDPNPDYFQGKTIRIKYPLHGCDGLATVSTVTQILQAAPGFTAYAALMYVKGAKEVDTSSGVFDVFHLFFAALEPLVERMMVSLGGRWYLVRTLFKSAAGFLTTVVDELAEPVVEVASFGVRTYDPLTDSNVDVFAPLTVVRVRWQSAFEYLSAGSEKYVRGDAQVMMPKTVSPKAQDGITLSDGPWRVLSVLDETTYWSVHLRRV